MRAAVMMMMVILVMMTMEMITAPNPSSESTPSRWPRHRGASLMKALQGALRADSTPWSAESELQEAIILELEYFRDGMDTGFPQWNIPPLDPYVIGDLPFNVSWDQNTLYGSLFDTQMFKLSTFETTQVLVNILFGVELTLGLEVPTLRFNGTYDLGGEAMRMNITGNGNYHVDLNDVRLKVYTYLIPTNFGRNMRVQELEFDLIVNGADVQFENLMGGGMPGLLMNQAMSTALPVVIEVLEEQYKPNITEYLTNSLNAYLQDHPVLPIS